MNKPLYFILAVTCIWLGVSLGANLLAAPAKFTVTSLDRADLVTVGRAQFTWVGRLEMGLAAALLFAAVKSGGTVLPKALLIFGVLAIAILIAQRFALHPALIQSPSSALHIAYVTAEVAKAVCLAITILIAVKIKI